MFNFQVQIEMSQRVRGKNKVTILSHYTQFVGLSVEQIKKYIANNPFEKLKRPHPPLISVSPLNTQVHLHIVIKCQLSLQCHGNGNR